jgi:hypothetical protein
MFVNSFFFRWSIVIMKKEIVCLLLGSLLITGLSAQTTDSIHKNQGKKFAVSAGIDIPAGEFPQTHSFGGGGDLSWSNHRFGMMKKKPVKLIGFTANAGIDHYFGRNRTVSTYQINYGDFTYLHVYGGAIYNPCKKGNIQLTAGSGAGLIDGIIEFWWGVNLTGSYYINEKIAITPGIIFMKQSIADPLIAGILRASWSF